MSKKVKAVVIAGAAVLALLAILAFVLWDSDFGRYVRYNYYANYVPPIIEARLMDMARIDDGELLTEEEVSAFFDEFEGQFRGNYNDGPDCMRTLIERFVERVNNRYGISISPQDVIINAGSEFSLSAGLSEGIRFHFVENENIKYSYTKEAFVSKTVWSVFPYDVQDKRQAFEKWEDGWDGNYYLNLIDGVGDSAPHRDAVYVYHHPEFVAMHKLKFPLERNEKGKQIPTSDFDEYFQDVSQGNAAHLDDELSFINVEKYIAAKRKSETTQ